MKVNGSRRSAARRRSMRPRSRPTRWRRRPVAPTWRRALRGVGGSGPTSIEIEPMGNMPVIKDLVDRHGGRPTGTRSSRVTLAPPHGEAPEREYIVEPESMIDITQSMACIQCGACVSACLSMEADPLFVGPAALAKAYRFVGDPRDAEQLERLDPTSPTTRTGSTTARTASAASTPAPRAWRRWTRSCACVAQARRERHRGPSTPATARDGLRQHHPEEGHPRRASCCRSPAPPASSAS